MPGKIKLKNKVLKGLIKAIGEHETQTFIIADGVEYGVFVEFGTSRAAAQPFLRPAFDAVTQQLPKAIGKAIEAGVSPNDVLRKAAFDIQARAQGAAPVDTGALRNSLHVEEQ